MPRPLPPATAATVTSTVTKPGYLVEVGFSTPLRGCSRGAVTVGGVVFPSRGFDVRWTQDNARGGPEVSIIFDDLDATVTTLILGENVADRSVRVWALYGDPTTLGGVIDAREAVLLFEGLGDTASIDPTGGKTSLSAYQEGSATVFVPRIYFTRENGFNHLPPQGARLAWGGEEFVLEPEAA